MKIVISACLLGVNCRYDGSGKSDEKWMEALKGHVLIPVCPEQLGGLSTPRLPCEIVNTEPVHIISRDGADITAAFVKGACETLKLSELLGAECAVLKERSPSCGVNQIYDGSFSGVVIPGQGLTAKKLLNAGIRIYSDEEIVRFAEDNLKG